MMGQLNILEFTLHAKYCAFNLPKQGAINLSRLRAAFTISYQLVGHWVINENNLLKLNGNLLKELPAYYCKHVYILQNNLLQKN
jgi:hypothetical protein